MYRYRIVVHDYHDDRETRRIYGAKYRTFESDLSLDEFIEWYAARYGQSLHIPQTSQSVPIYPYLDEVACDDKTYGVTDLKVAS
jgi:hypothetical protein